MAARLLGWRTALLTVLLSASTSALAQPADFGVPGFEWPERDLTEVTMTVHRRPVVVRLLADEPLTYHLKLGSGRSATYEELCTAPCWATLEWGEQRLAISVEGLDPVDVARAVRVTDRSTLRASYRQRRPARASGYVAMALAAAAGAALVIAGALHQVDDCVVPGSPNCQTTPHPDRRLLVPGAIILPLSALGAALWARWGPRDRAEVTVEPGWADWEEHGG